MDWYTIAKSFYAIGWLNKSSLKQWVSKGKLTESEYKTITGEDYT